MIYSLFLYQTTSGLLLWDKSFEQKMNSRQVELFSSFFSAIQSFVKEMISNSSKGLQSLEMGNFLVNITNLDKLGLDIVIISDKEDDKSLRKFTPKLIKLLKSHSELFQNWDGARDRFRVLDLEILQLLRDDGKLLGNKSLTEGRNEILESIVNKMPQLEEEQKDRYLKERLYLEERLKTEPNLLKKLNILGNVEDISQKLKDLDKINETQRQRRKILSELDSTKQKLSYFLGQTKEAISKTVEYVGGRTLADLDYRDAYLNLYSFSTKLKLVGAEDQSNTYRKWAKILIDKPEEEKKELPQLISRILQLPDDIETYIQKDV